jgi:hypothetical protein
MDTFICKRFKFITCPSVCQLDLFHLSFPMFTRHVDLTTTELRRETTDGKAGGQTPALFTTDARLLSFVSRPSIAYTRRRTGRVLSYGEPLITLVSSVLHSRPWTSSHKIYMTGDIPSYWLPPLIFQCMIWKKRPAIPPILTKPWSKTGSLSEEIGKLVSASLRVASLTAWQVHEILDFYWLDAWLQPMNGVKMLDAEGNGGLI